MAETSNSVEGTAAGLLDRRGHIHSAGRECLEALLKKLLEVEVGRLEMTNRYGALLDWVDLFAVGHMRWQNHNVEVDCEGSFYAEAFAQSLYRHHPFGFHFLVTLPRRHTEWP